MVWARLGAVDVAPDSSSEGCWIPTGDTNWEKYAQNIIYHCFCPFKYGVSTVCRYMPLLACAPWEDILTPDCLSLPDLCKYYDFELITDRKSQY